MNEFLNEGDAWREAARRIAEGQLRYGICKMLLDMSEEGVMANRTRLDMHDRIDAAYDEDEPWLDEGGNAYLFPSGENADERVLYCLLMGEMWEYGD